MFFVEKRKALIIRTGVTVVKISAFFALTGFVIFIIIFRFIKKIF